MALSKPSGVPGSKENIFQRHLNRCFFKEGEEVCFKKPRRNPTRGIVLKILKDFSQVTWTQGGAIPNYIQLAVEDKKTGNTLHVWTCENKLRKT